MLDITAGHRRISDCLNIQRIRGYTRRCSSPLATRSATVSLDSLRVPTDYLIEPFSLEELVARFGFLVCRSSARATPTARSAIWSRRCKSRGDLAEVSMICPPQPSLNCCVFSCTTRDGPSSAAPILERGYGITTPAHDPASWTLHLRLRRRSTRVRATIHTVCGVGYCCVRLNEPGR